MIEKTENKPKEAGDSLRLMMSLHVNKNTGTNQH